MSRLMGYNLISGSVFLVTTAMPSLALLGVVASTKPRALLRRLFAFRVLPFYVLIGL